MIHGLQITLSRVYMAFGGQKIVGIDSALHPDQGMIDVDFLSMNEFLLKDKIKQLIRQGVTQINLRTAKDGKESVIPFTIQELVQ